MYSYLITDKDTGKRHIAEASSPSVAIADAAADKFTAERIDGGVLELLSGSLTVKRIGKVAEAKPAVKDDANPPPKTEGTTTTDDAGKS